jgi:hypothetical protein
MNRSARDIGAGLAFVVFGVAFAVGASAYELGSLLRMGPGFFPLALGIVLALLGVVIVAQGFLERNEIEPIGVVPWRAVALVLVAVAFFGLTVRGLGVAPAMFLTALVAGLAARRSGFVVPVAVAVGLTIAGVLIFVIALQLRLPILGPWLRS